MKKIIPFLPLPGVDGTRPLTASAKFQARTEDEAFARRHRPSVFRVCLGVLGEPQLAEDAAQEAILQAVRKRGQIEGDQDAWVRRIAVRIAWREAKRWPQAALAEPPIQCESPLAEQRTEVRDALSRISPDHRVVLALAFGEGLSHAEIASALGIPEGTVASRIHNAKAAFKKQWGDER